MAKRRQSPNIGFLNVSLAGGKHCHCTHTETSSSLNTEQAGDRFVNLHQSPNETSAGDLEDYVPFVRTSFLSSGKQKSCNS